MSLLSKLNTSSLIKAEDVIEKEPMTDDYAEKLSEVLRTEGRSNVWPNKYDMNKPYRVSVQKRGKYQQYGLFTDIEAAAAVGTIAAMAVYGKKAIQGTYDAEAAEKSPEFIAWAADSQNAATLKAAMSV